MASREKKLYSTVLVGRAGQHRRDRRAARRAAAHAYAEDAEQRKAAARALAEAEKAERAATTYLPRGGEPGPAALRAWRRFRLPAHQDTSATLAGAYP
jgi:hypothetical protein